jgi:hypothetical protein
MTLDLYSYGRTVHQEPSGSIEEPRGETFLCARCGCSVTGESTELIANLGWRVLDGAAQDGEHPALCPRCSRRWVVGMP